MQTIKNDIKKYPVMKRSNRYSHKLKIFEKALNGFRIAMQIDVSTYPDDVADVLKNGQIQKFEYCAELTWKIIKVFLYEYKGISIPSPHEIIMEFYSLGIIDQPNCELLISMVNDRNKLMHMYIEEFIDEVHSKLGSYLSTMDKVLEVLKNF